MEFMSLYFIGFLFKAHNHTIHEDSQGWVTVAQAVFDVSVALHAAEFPAHL
jgi:hypothetical protein